MSVSRSQGSVSWTEIYTLRSVSPTPQVSVRSYGSASVAATYSGPLPGTLCYDGSCRQAAPGYYTAPPEEVIRTWTETRTRSCPPGYRGSITVTERWETVKYWTPSAGGLSSRGTLTFTSATQDEMVDRTEEDNCEPIEPPSSDGTGDTGEEEEEESSSEYNIDLGVIPSSSQTTRLSQRPPFPKRQVTLLPFLPPREGLW
ncbi:hypothetical protein TO73_2849 (plasmid) [Thermus aquaticus Y51MC23]|uniref:Uncharacterized protein n=1 Tax=Thermus aquaticus (strain ATCC BAA-2747 / Y51MC23) TaxID=498848 RepID=A0ABM5VQK6_THEA5|nr:hypothetical protein TO73_2849 [Thermus aquaticus Y51MC23]